MSGRRRARADHVELCLDLLERLESLIQAGQGDRQLVAAGGQAMNDVTAACGGRVHKLADAHTLADVTSSLVQAVRSVAASGLPVLEHMKSLRLAVSDLANGIGLEPVAEGLHRDSELDQDVAYLMAEHLAEALFLTEGADGSLRRASRYPRIAALWSKVRHALGR